MAAKKAAVATAKNPDPAIEPLSIGDDQEAGGAEVVPPHAKPKTATKSATKLS